MRILLDTNIFILLEDSSQVLKESGADFFKLASNNNYQLLVHPDSIEDIKKDKDENRKKISLSRLRKYSLLETPPECEFNLKTTNTLELYNDEIDNKILCAIVKNAANFLLTEDRGIHEKAKKLGIAERVYYVQQIVDRLNYLHNKTRVTLPNLVRVPLYSLELKDPFFESLRDDYEIFDEWFSKAQQEGRNAWILEAGERGLNGICIYKEEDEPVLFADNPALPGAFLKICTFKVGEKIRGQKLGELLLKACFRYATENKKDHIYITVRPNHQPYLEHLLSDFGFVQKGKSQSKGGVHSDSVFIKEHPLTPPPNEGSPIEYHIKYSPHFIGGKVVGKFIVPIQPVYHKILFSDWDDNQQQANLFPSPSVGNAIKQAYLCNARIKGIKPGDVLLFYRSIDEKAITSIGIVEEIMDSTDPDEIAQSVAKRTVYTYEGIKKMAEKPTKVILFRLAAHLKKSVKYEWLLKNCVVSGSIQTIRKIEHDLFKKIVSEYKIECCLLN